MGKIKITSESRRQTHNERANIGTLTPVAKRRGRMLTSTPISKAAGEREEAVLNNILKDIDIYSRNETGVDIAWDCNSPDTIKTILRSQMQKGLLEDISMQLNLDEATDEVRVTPKTPQSVKRSRRILKKRRPRKPNCDYESLKEVLHKAANYMCRPDSDSMPLLCEPSHGSDILSLERADTRARDVQSLGASSSAILTPKFNSDSDDLFVDKENPVSDAPLVMLETSRDWSDDDLFGNESFLVKATQSMDRTTKVSETVTSSKSSKQNCDQILEFKNAKVTNFNVKDGKHIISAVKKPSTDVNLSADNANSFTNKTNPCDVSYVNSNKLLNIPAVSNSTSNTKNVISHPNQSSKRIPVFPNDTTKSINFTKQIENKSTFFPRHNSLGTPNCMRSLSDEYKAKDALDKSFKRHKSDVSWDKSTKMSNFSSNASLPHKQCTITSNDTKHGDNNVKQNTKSFSDKISHDSFTKCFSKSSSTVSSISKSIPLQKCEPIVKNLNLNKIAPNANNAIKETDKTKVQTSKVSDSFSDLNASFNTSFGEDILRQLAEPDDYLESQLNKPHKNGAPSISKTVSTAVKSATTTLNNTIVRSNCSTVMSNTTCATLSNLNLKIANCAIQNKNVTPCATTNYGKPKPLTSNNHKPSTYTKNVVSSVASADICNFVKKGTSLSHESVQSKTIQPQQDSRNKPKQAFNFRRTVSNHCIYLPQSKPSNIDQHAGMSSTQRACSAGEIERKKQLAQQKLQRKKLDMLR